MHKLSTTHRRPPRARLCLGLAAALAALLTGAGTLDAGPHDGGSVARSEPALPRFVGPLLDGGSGGSDLVVGRRALVVAYSPGNDDLERAARIVRSIAADAGAANLRLLGVAVGVDRVAAQRLPRPAGFDFPIVLDPDLVVARKLGVTGGETSVLAVDAEGYIVGGFTGLEDDGTLEAYLEDELRGALYLRRPGAALAPALGVRPPVPEFSVRSLDGEELSSASIEGRAAVILLFNPTCPHCHELLQFFKGFLAREAHPELVFAPVSVSDRLYVVEQMVADLELPFPVYLAGGKETLDAFDFKLAVPDTLVIDRAGRVAGRHVGTGPRVEALLTMQIRGALGVANPILLDRKGYSGEAFCAVCHADAHGTWSLTTHAHAFETLVEHGADRNPECLPCHTVGWNEAGGYTPDTRPAHLEGVQCENCHGRGGPHQSPEFAQQGLQPVCESCHTPEHSLRFEFAQRLPLVSHAANLQFSGLSVEERLALLERRDRRERTLFEPADHVGSSVCASCHADEHARWSRSPHARALETLAARGEAANAECQACHTTGFEQPGGWPAGGDALAGVGCESCHGPGGRHVAEGASRQGTILRLTEKCDSCVIGQICGSCHDEANDPGFEFELDAKLDRIRHGFRDREAPAP